MTTFAAGDRRGSIDALAVTLMFVITFSWGLNGVAAKVANVGYSPVFLSLVRSIGGAVLVFLWCRWRRIPLFERDGTLWPGLVIGTIFGVEFLLIFIGLDYTSAARGTLFVNTMPFWMLIAAHYILGEKVTVTKVIGLVLAFAGVVLALSDGLSMPGPDALLGDMMNIVAGAAWAGTLVIIRKTGLARIPAEKVLLYQLVVSAGVALVALPFFVPAVREGGLLASLGVAYQTVYIVGLTYVIWFWLIQRYPASGVTSFNFLTPVFAVLLGGFLLGEPLGPTIFVSLALISAGLLIVNRPTKSPT